MLLAGHSKPNGTLCGQTTYGSRRGGLTGAGALETPTPIQEGSSFTLFERQDDYCSTAFRYQTLPTQPFPMLPNRKLRSIVLEKRKIE